MHVIGRCYFYHLPFFGCGMWSVGVPAPSEILDRMMTIWDGALKDELGDFDVIDVPPHEDTGPRKVLVPKTAVSREEWKAVYVTAGRLIVDDYVPEIWDGTL